MLNRIKPKPRASGATMAAQTGAVMISHTAAVGRISSTRRRDTRGSVDGNVNSLQSTSKLADSQSGLVRRERGRRNGRRNTARVDQLRRMSKAGWMNWHSMAATSSSQSPRACPDTLTPGTPRGTFVLRPLLSLLLLAASLVGSAPSAHADEACGLTDPAFCDTFDTPQNGGTRSGDLNSVVWGVSRTSGNVDMGQNSLNGWFPTTLQACDGDRANVMSPNDVIICNGQLREAMNDGHTVATLAMYPKQPFDFAGRTGKVTFDVSNDTLGSHDAWPEFW